MKTDGKKSELGFFNFLVQAKHKTKAQAKNEIALAIFNQIIEDPENKLSQYPQRNTMESCCLSPWPDSKKHSSNIC